MLQVDLFSLQDYFHYRRIKEDLALHRNDLYALLCHGEEEDDTNR